MATDKQVEFYQEVQEHLYLHDIEILHLFKDSPKTLCIIVTAESGDKTDNLIYMLGFNLVNKISMVSGRVAFIILYPGEIGD